MIPRKSARVNRHVAKPRFDLSALPRESKALEPFLRSPVGQQILGTIARAVTEGGLAPSRVPDAIGQLLDFYSSDSHRCIACLGWVSENFVSEVFVYDGKFRLVILCPECKHKLNTHTETPSMLRNLLVYTEPA